MDVPALRGKVKVMVSPLILLPGMMCDARLFCPQIEALSAHVTIQVAAIGGHDTIGALAAEILAQAPPRFALAGVSMGGIVAMEMYAQAAGRIERLALMDTNPLAEEAERRMVRDIQIDKVRNGGLKQVMQEEMKPLYLTDTPRRQQVLDLCMEMAVKLGAEVFVRQSRALRMRRDQQETLRTVDVPTLVLCGEDDRLCPVERHELMHRLISGSELKIIHRAGHLPTLEQPDRVSEALSNWLSG
jgi:pimeloyl-ACP methyl ester carboxylesterase